MNALSIEHINNVDWRPVVIDNQITKYAVSKTGKVLSYCGKKPRFIKGRISYDGYHNAVLRVDGKPKTIKVHRLVAHAFIPNPYGLETVNHKDGDKLNNSVKNLEWMSQADNYRHALTNGLCNNRGESNGQSKLSRSQVIDIKSQLASGRLQKDIAKEFNVVVQTISKIKNGQCWGGVKQDDHPGAMNAA